jgi:Methyltransferase domain
VRIRDLMVRSLASIPPRTHRSVLSARVSTFARQMPIVDATDPDRTGASLKNLADVIFPCLDAVRAGSVLEVGASHGDFTGALLEWAAGSGASIAAVDPTPAPELLALADGHPELDLVRKTSHEALRSAPRYDAIVIDGDHNYYTVSEDLRLIDNGTTGGSFPLVLLHDLGWPHGRRDSYYAPDRVPARSRQPLAHNAFLDPEERGIADGGLLVEWAAKQEGGARNGVRTAVEDFVREHEGLRLAIVPAFFGLGVLWRSDRPWSAELERILEPLDDASLLRRLEENRVLKQVEWARCFRAKRAEEGRMRAQEELLNALLQSRTLTWIERLSRVGGRGRSPLSRDRIRRVLGRPTEGG